MIIYIFLSRHNVVTSEAVHGSSGQVKSLMSAMQLKDEKKTILSVCLDLINLLQL